MHTIQECRDWIDRYNECIRAIIEFRRKNLLLGNSKRRWLRVIILRLKLLRIGVRQKVRELEFYNPIFFALSDEICEIDGDTSTPSTACELDAETLVLETLKIRDIVGIQSLCEAAWTSIFHRGIECFTRDQRNVMKHIARYSSARECTVSCIVGDKDISRCEEVYVTAIACTPLMLLRDIENNSTEVYEGLYPTTVMSVDAFLDNELQRYVRECPRLVYVSSFYGPKVLPIAIRYPDANSPTWRKRLMEHHTIVFIK